MAVKGIGLHSVVGEPGLEPYAEPLPDGYLEAGREYFNSLLRVGFEPDLAIWARDREVDEWVLLLSSPLLDAVGPLKIMEVLFKAYDASITTRAISPFVVRLQSPIQNTVKAIKAFLSGDMHSRFNIKVIDDMGRIAMQPLSSLDDADNVFADHSVTVRVGWRYIAGEREAKVQNPYRAFKAFARQVDRLAA